MNGILDGIVQGVTNGLNYQTSMVRDRNQRQSIMDLMLQNDQAKYAQEHSPDRINQNIQEATQKALAESQTQQQIQDAYRSHLMGMGLGTKTVGQDGKASYSGGHFSDYANQNPDWATEVEAAHYGLKIPHHLPQEALDLLKIPTPENIMKAMQFAKDPEDARMIQEFGKTSQDLRKQYQAVHSGDKMVAFDPSTGQYLGYGTTVPVGKMVGEGGPGGSGGSGKMVKVPEYGEDGSIVGYRWMSKDDADVSMSPEAQKMKMLRSQIQDEIKLSVPKGVNTREWLQPQTNANGELDDPDIVTKRKLRNMINEYDQLKTAAVSRSGSIPGNRPSTVAPKKAPSAGAATTNSSNGGTDQWVSTQKQGNSDAGTAGTQVQTSARDLLKKVTGRK